MKKNLFLTIALFSALTLNIFSQTEMKKDVMMAKVVSFQFLDFGRQKLEEVFAAILRLL